MEKIEILIEENAKLIYKIANMFRNSGCDLEDLKQAGVLGFIEAYQNFEDDRNVKFTTYAYPYVYGSISKYVRENKGIKISRDITKLYYKIEKARLSLIQVLMREPTVKELACELGTTEEVLNEALISRNRLMSIDESVGSGENDLTLHEVIADKSYDVDERILLEDALSMLSESEYELVKNRYFDELTQSEVANKLNTSQVQVSRREQKVMKKLRTFMTC